MDKKRMLVISSHAFDFVWRAGGTIAGYARRGWEIKVICLTYGERGESENLWLSNNKITEPQVKEIRKNESEKAAKILGVSSIEFFDWGDHLLVINKEQVLEIGYVIKSYRPDIILTQFERDVLNYDHPETAISVFKAVRCARVSGVYPEFPKLSALPNIFMYDPSQPELFGFNPDTYIDITQDFQTKVDAMSVSDAQTYLIDAYRARAEYRGASAKTFSGDKNIKYSEAFVRFYPYVGKEFL